MQKNLPAVRKWTGCRLFLFILALWGISSALSAQDFDKVKIETTKITESVFMLQGAGGNIGVSVGPDGVLLIDDEFPQLIEKIKAEIARLNPGPIRIVLNTNWHYDHADGNELLAKAGALIIAHENSRKHMLGEQRIPEMDPDFKLGPYPEAALPKITIRDSATIYFNGDEIMILHVPGAHSDGDLLFHFRKANVIHAGDLFFTNGFPFINLSSGGTVDGMLAGAEKILSLADEKTKVIPGHGPLSNREGVREFRDLLVAGRDRVAKLIKEGKTLEEIQKADPLAGLFKGGKSWLPPQMFVKLVFMDLTKK